jgi:hypothetical protein
MPKPNAADARRKSRRAIAMAGFRRLGFLKTWFPKIFEARQPTRSRREHHMNLPDQKWPSNHHG